MAHSPRHMQGGVQRSTSGTVIDKTGTIPVFFPPSLMVKSDEYVLSRSVKSAEAEPTCMSHKHILGLHGGVTRHLQ